MSPEQLSRLREISKLFEQGKATHEQIKQLNDILTLINRPESYGNLYEEKRLDEQKVY